MSESSYYIEELTSLTPGKPIRILPFGTLVKNGKRREITPELAKQFNIPHFRPPIKLGSHADTTPAGGFIEGLYVGEDGLYSNNEFTDKGNRAIADGDYRYFSPEIIWPGAGIENPVTGEVIQGPLIVGLALLHTPHLGEAAALYSYEILEQTSMTDTNEITELTEVTAPPGFWDRLAAFFIGRQAETETEPEAETDIEEPQGVQMTDNLNTAIDVDEFTALKAERDDFAAKLAAIEQAETHRLRVEHFSAELTDTKAPELAAVLADLSDEQAAPILVALRALSAQIDDTELTAEIGSVGDAAPVDPSDKIGMLINQKIQEGLTYADAFSAARLENTALFAEVYK